MRHDCLRWRRRRFLCAAIKLYQSAARLETPVVNPETYGFTIEGRWYALADCRLNRGMLAVRDLVNGDLTLFEPITFRLMSLGPAIAEVRDLPKFARFFKEDEERAWVVSEALMSAFGEAPLVPPTMKFDLDAIYERATKRLDVEEQ